MYKLTLEYDGTAFHGSQAQAPDKGRTVQGTLEAALARITGTAVRVALAGRTDSGVHARGQVASFDLRRPWTPHDLRRALNAVLPPDLVVRAAEPAPDGFHARFSATARGYRYLIRHAPAPSALARHLTWHQRGALDLARMQAAAAVLPGTHDFAAFAGQGWGVPGADPDAAGPNTVRTLTLARLHVLPPAADWWGGLGDDEEEVGTEFPSPSQGEGSGVREGRLIAFDVIGNAFLPHMVRNLAGTLVEIGRGVRPPDAIATLLTTRDRRQAAATAPPQGLCLVRVWYDDVET
jgi:tRNA pseudouridine38-40 synthase